MLTYVWLIPILPLAGAALAGLMGLVRLRRTGQRLGKPIVSVIALGSVGLSFLLSVMAVFQLFWVEQKEIYIIDLFTWLDVGPARLTDGSLASLKIPWGFQLDPLSAV